jgi:hypothetical protein
LWGFLAHLNVDFFRRNVREGGEKLAYRIEVNLVVTSQLRTL